MSAAKACSRRFAALIVRDHVSTKYGPGENCHICFYRLGAFHIAKNSSDLLPELQGRCPCGLKLRALTEE